VEIHRAFALSRNSQFEFPIAQKNTPAALSSQAQIAMDSLDESAARFGLSVDPLDLFPTSDQPEHK